MSDTPTPVPFDKSSQARIDGIENDLRKLYQEEEASRASFKERKKQLNAMHREAVMVAHQKRLDAINADPALKAQYESTNQDIGV